MNSGISADRMRAISFTRITGWVSLLLLMQAVTATHALAVTAQTFTYQGRFLTPDGADPITDTVDIRLSIYSPDGSCLLYQEQHSGVNLALTSGLFALSVGSGLPP